MSLVPAPSCWLIDLLRVSQKYSDLYGSLTSFVFILLSFCWLALCIVLITSLTLLTTSEWSVLQSALWYERVWRTNFKSDLLVMQRSSWCHRFERGWRHETLWESCRRSMYLSHRGHEHCKIPVVFVHCHLLCQLHVGQNILAIHRCQSRLLSLNHQVCTYVLSWVLMWLCSPWLGRRCPFHHLVHRELGHRHWWRLLCLAKR